MLISHGFDESNAERRKRAFKNALTTASKLNNRVKLFIDNINKNSSLTTNQKLEIIKKITENL